jgi:hypothetical protein
MPTQSRGHGTRRDRWEFGYRLSGGEKIPAGDEKWIPAGVGIFFLIEERIPGEKIPGGRRRGLVPLVLDKAYGPAHLPSVLQVGMEAVERHHAYLRGDMIGPRNTLVDGTQ